MIIYFKLIILGYVHLDPDDDKKIEKKGLTGSRKSYIQHALLNNYINSFLPCNILLHVFVYFFVFRFRRRPSHRLRLWG